VPNLVVRILVAFAGIPLLLWIVWTGGYPLWILVVLLQIVMFIEWKQLLAKRGIIVSAAQTALPIAALYTAYFQHDYPLLSGAAILLIALWIVSFVFRRSKNRISEMGGGLLFVVYAALPVLLWPLLRLSGSFDRFSCAGALIVLFAATWCCDSGAYFVGRSLGRHKLYEQASPKKTVEGAVGGILFSILPLVLIKLFGWGHPTALDYLALTIAVGVFGQAGDLLESLFKRESGVKDSSALIPGHGGVLDRFDSLLLSTPVFYAYFMLVP